MSTRHALLSRMLWLSPLLWLLFSAPSLLAATDPAAIASAPLSLVPAKAAGLLRVMLDPALADSWQQAALERLAVRSPGAVSSVPVDTLPASRALDLRLAKAACLLLLVDFEPPLAHHAKAIACDSRGSAARRLANRLAAAAWLTARTGTACEIQPMANPATLRAGADLPIRIFRDGMLWSGAEVVAIGPGGQRLERRADAAGTAVIPIASAGRWQVLVQDPGAGGAAGGASLLFEVPSEATWEALGNGGAP